MCRICRLGYQNAIHEGVAHEDIVAGAVYSICMNYTKTASKETGRWVKKSMQGGVCYNYAVPLAMAALVSKSDQLSRRNRDWMGAFGVALEVKKRIENNIMQGGAL
ncbi:MAG: hypothetical protein R2874_03380 [Desulfobacterales bacterium]